MRKNSSADATGATAEATHGMSPIIELGYLPVLPPGAAVNFPALPFKSIFADCSLP